jgi:osmotically-inducible protein OsmY
MTLVKRSSALLCTVFALAALGCASTATRESTGEYIDDSGITTRVKTAIFNEPSLKVFEINVETYRNAVHLQGSAASAADVDKAGSVARSVTGVVSVKNDILVK